MAIQKDIVTDSGVVLSYWRIVEVNVNQDTKQAKIIVYPYVSEYARVSGKPPVHSEDMRIVVEDLDYSGSDFDEMSLLDYTNNFSPNAMDEDSNIYVCAYNYLKGLPKFEGAIDV